MLNLKVTILAAAAGAFILSWSDTAEAQAPPSGTIYTCDYNGDGNITRSYQPCPEGNNDRPQRQGDSDRDVCRSLGNCYAESLTFTGFRQQWGALASGQPDSPAWIAAVSYSNGDGGYNTREEAEAKALENCESYSRGVTRCEIVETFVNSCGSIATGDGNKPGRRFFGVTPIQGAPRDGDALRAAYAISRARATDLCERELGAGQCEVKRTNCTPFAPTYE